MYPLLALQDIFLQRSKTGFCNINQGFLASLLAGRGKSGTRLAMNGAC